MDAMDSDSASRCIEMEGAAAGEPPAAGGHQVPPMGDPWSLLALARRLMNQGNPSHALQAVVAAMRSQGGEEAVFQALNRAREVYKKRVAASAAADELASLFAECAISEAQQPMYPPEQTLHGEWKTSILEKSGRRQIMLDAYSDGSSFVCLQCGGLVSSQRKDEHLAYWCG